MIVGTCPCRLFDLGFCYYAHGYLRDLHSFPTRRSSDLSTLWQWPTKRVRKSRNFMNTSASSPGPSRVVSFLKAFNGGPPDRKSTRLNSSHQIISYAVFCLKKKKHSYHTRESSRKEAADR